MLDSDTMKAFFDFHKHLTTLSTAALLAFATVLEKFRPIANDTDRLFANGICSAFGLSLFTALMGMFSGLALFAARTDEPAARRMAIAAIAMTMGEALSFYLGVMLIFMYIRR